MDVYFRALIIWLNGLLSITEPTGLLSNDNFVLICYIYLCYVG